MISKRFKQLDLATRGISSPLIPLLPSTESAVIDSYAIRHIKGVAGHGFCAKPVVWNPWSPFASRWILIIMRNNILQSVLEKVGLLKEEWFLLIMKIEWKLYRIVIAKSFIPQPSTSKRNAVSVSSGFYFISHRHPAAAWLRVMADPLPPCRTPRRDMVMRCTTSCDIV